MRTEDDIIKQWKHEGQKGRDILVELWNHQTTFDKYKKVEGNPMKLSSRNRGQFE